MLQVADSSTQADELSSLAGIVILAGGASKRMGSPKAELILPTGERLLDYHVRQALELSAAMMSNLPIMIADNGRVLASMQICLRKNCRRQFSILLIIFLLTLFLVKVFLKKMINRLKPAARW